MSVSEARRCPVQPSELPGVWSRVKLRRVHIRGAWMGIAHSGSSTTSGRTWKRSVYGSGSPKIGLSSWKTSDATSSTPHQRDSFTR